MKQIPLTQGLSAVVDDRDWAILGSHKWYAKRNGRTWYAERAIRRADGKRTTVRMHQIILGTDIDVDHKDGDGLNNQRRNLRPATRSQNSRNSRSKRGTSRFKGVSQIRARWRAQIYLPNRKKRSLGCYASEHDAARAYDEAARALFGEFARLNFEPEVA